MTINVLWPFCVIMYWVIFQFTQYIHTRLEFDSSFFLCILLSFSVSQFLSHTRSSLSRTLGDFSHESTHALLVSVYRLCVYVYILYLCRPMYDRSVASCFFFGIRVFSFVKRNICPFSVSFTLIRTQFPVRIINFWCAIVVVVVFFSPYCWFFFFFIHCCFWTIAGQSYFNTTKVSVRVVVFFFSVSFYLKLSIYSIRSVYFVLFYFYASCFAIPFFTKFTIFAEMLFKILWYFVNSCNSWHIYTVRRFIFSILCLLVCVYICVVYMFVYTCMYLFLSFSVYWSIL